MNAFDVARQKFNAHGISTFTDEDVDFYAQLEMWKERTRSHPTDNEEDRDGTIRFAEARQQEIIDKLIRAERRKAAKDRRLKPHPMSG